MEESILRRLPVQTLQPYSKSLWTSLMVRMVSLSMYMHVTAITDIHVRIIKPYALAVLCIITLDEKDLFVKGM